MGHLLFRKFKNEQEIEEVEIGLNPRETEGIVKIFTAPYKEFDELKKKYKGDEYEIIPYAKVTFRVYKK